MSEALYCPIKNSQCSVKPEMSPSPMGFIAIPFRDEMIDTRKTVVNVLKKHGIQPYLADEDVTTGRDILCKICEKITFSDFGIIELTSVNPNVMLEFGIILGRSKPVFILLNKKADVGPKYIPVDIVALDRIEYTSQQNLSKKFEDGIKQYTERLDRKKKELATMMQIVRGAARDKEFTTTDRLLDIIFDRMGIEKGGNGNFVNLLEEISTEVSDPNFSFRYSLALARGYAFQKNFKKSVSCAKDVINKRTSIVKNILEKAENIVDKETAELILKNEKGLLEEPFYAIVRRIKGDRKTGDLFAYIWYLIGKFEEPEKIVLSLQKIIRESFLPPKIRFTYPFGTRLWDHNSFAFEVASFLNAFIEMYPNKESKAVNIAQETINSLDNVLTAYYKSV